MSARNAVMIVCILLLIVVTARRVNAIEDEHRLRDMAKRRLPDRGRRRR